MNATGRDDGFAPEPPRFVAAAPRAVTRLSTERILFSQSTIGPTTRLGGKAISTRALAAHFAEHGYRAEPIEVVQFTDGRLVSIDNRRLWAARTAGLRDLPVVLCLDAQPCSALRRENGALRRSLWEVDGRLMRAGPPGEERFRRRTEPTTVGEFVTFRAANQQHALSNGRAFPPEGSLELPRLMPIRLPAGRSSQIASNEARRSLPVVIRRTTRRDDGLGR